jgi:multiple antibiotic resistance protein
MVETTTTFIRIVMLAFAALLPIINPAGAAPIFLSLTPGVPDPVRTALARRIAWNSFVLLVSALLVGSYVLMLFGLSLAVIKIAGGLLVIATAWHLVRADESPDSGIVANSPASHEHLESQSFYPLTFPLTIGPGSIAVAVTLGAGMREGDVADVTSVLGALTGILLVASSVYLCHRFASRLLNALATRDCRARLSVHSVVGGVQILCDGIAGDSLAGVVAPPCPVRDRVHATG